MRWFLTVSDPRSEPPGSTVGFSKFFDTRADVDAWMRANADTPGLYRSIRLEEIEVIGEVQDEVECESVATYHWHPDYGFVPPRLWHNLSEGPAVLDFDRALAIVSDLYRLGITTGVRYDGSVAYMEGLLLHAPVSWRGTFETAVRRIFGEGERRSADVTPH